MASLMCYAKILSLMFGAGCIFFLTNLLSKKTRLFRRFRLIGRVSALYCYPVAACSGMVNNIATCTFRGLKMIGAYDAQFIIGRETDEAFAVSSPKGTVKQFFNTTMRQMQALCNGCDLLLSSLDGDTFIVPLKQSDHNGNVIQLRCAENVVAVLDLGDVVANWLCNKLEMNKLRLYQVLFQIRCVTPGRSTFGNYVFTVQDSVDYLNEAIDMDPILKAHYFRPNIVVSGCSPLDETKWTFIRIGNVHFKVSCADSRIISTNSNCDNLGWKPSWEAPAELPNNVQVIDSFSFSADVGVNAKLLSEGEINVGDPVYAAY